MALNLTLQLANSEGLMKVILFTGLSHSVLVHPIVHGEPVLTAQPFYYLEELESVARLRFENHEDSLPDEEVEYLIDNYLFEYSKTNPNSTMTFKVSQGKFWQDDPTELYLRVDQKHTQSLAIDAANDSHVSFVRAVDQGDTVDLSDWDIGRNYADQCLQPYIQKLTALLDKKISTCISPSEWRDGYIGKLRILKAGYGLISHSQALALSDLSFRSIPALATDVPLGKPAFPDALDRIPVERIVTTKQHTPILLSYYFSGLKELNPLKGFVGFYNVLEYYFEEAPQLLHRSANNESKQLGCVVDWLTTETQAKEFIDQLEPNAQRAIFADLPTSSGIAILGLNITAGFRADLARWLYEIRCAVVHSKKTRHGCPTPTYEPYSSASQGLRNVLPVIRWLAILCIEKDHTLRTGTS